MEEKVIDVKNNFISKTFLWMFLGLFATGLISYFTYQSGLTENLFYSGTFSILCIIEVAVVLVFSFLFRKLSPGVVAILYFVYAIINGVGLSVIFYTFEIESIALVFFGTSALFGIFALLGYTTKLDLSKVGNICMGALVLGVILSIINLFIYNSILKIILDLGLLVVFFGVTAYDIQKIKMMQKEVENTDEKLHIYAAMEIYLDFINIFIRLLSLFGKRK